MEVTGSRYGVTRIDLPGAGTHGWQVRLQRRGVKYAKFFSDRVNGGGELALRLAQQWRDEILAKWETKEALARVCQVSSRNSSGVVGVSRIRVSSGNGVEYYFWQATWSPSPGERRCVRFSIRRYGDERAFEMAVEARRAAVGE